MGMLDLASSQSLSLSPAFAPDGMMMGSIDQWFSMVFKAKTLQSKGVYEPEDLNNIFKKICDVV